MNKNFQHVVKYFKPTPNLTHKQQVIRLYRQALRTSFSWCEDRDLWFEEATKIRADFDSNMKLPVGSTEASIALKKGQERLSQNVHPDQYILPYMPGGSLFMRNSPLPLEAIFPDGIPDDVSQRQVNIDFSNIPADQKYADKVFVDSISKSYWIDK